MATMASPAVTASVSQSQVHAAPGDTDAVVWRGNPSQITNLPIFVMCLLFVALGGVGYWALGHYEVDDQPWFVSYVFGVWLTIPVLIGFHSWLRTRCHMFELTTQRLRISTGIFSRQTDELELYRVRDASLKQPFFLRLVGLGNIVINTSDHTTPVVVLGAIRGAKRLREQLRTHVESMRDKKRVRHFDVPDGPGGF